MVTCQSANQLKTPAKVSWFFKMVSQFGSLGYTIMGKTADLTVVQKTIIDTLHEEGKTQTFITKEAVHRVLYPSMLTESWVEGKDAQPTKINTHPCMYILKDNMLCLYITYIYKWRALLQNAINAKLKKNEFVMPFCCVLNLFTAPSMFHAKSLYFLV